MIDSFPRTALRPRSWFEASERQTDLIFANQMHKALEGHSRLDRLRRSVREAIQSLPSELQNREELSALAAISKEIAVDVVRMEYAAAPDELGMKWFDFTASAIDRRWRAGAADMEFALARVAAASPAPGLRILSWPTANE